MRHDLNALESYLYEQLDAITNDDLKGEDLEKALERSKAVTELSRTIILSSQLKLQAAKLIINEGNQADVGLLGDGR